ncbi:hypothetical protein IX84_15310 [Phaeodactylibacter xiamenensis]|uniref:Uncharacterized protein n=1 Tax=Phaeodactylibacter xiamenensis TaxID=1524460 RepID=A0A098S8H2_9BACT|nr:hypothetical protein IX84_15310 [Phaeodactylibacter xiamenensis]
MDCMAFAQVHSPFIHIGQFADLAEATKVAVVSDPQAVYNHQWSYSPRVNFRHRMKFVKHKKRLRGITPKP